jgi:hypothetical protein
MRIAWLLLFPLVIQTAQSQERLDFTSDSLAVVSILRANNLDELNIYNVAQIDSSNRRITGLSLSYSWGCGCIGGVQVKNPISILPDELGRLTELKYLSLGDTELDSIPDGIGNLTKLEELGVGWSNISSLPEGISKLTNLKKLSLDANHFKSFPKGIFNFKALEELELSHFNFDSLPADIGNLTRLSSLSIQFGTMSALPKEIGLLTKLTKLAIYKTNIASLPPEVGNLSSLERLDLFRNQLVSLPGEITSLHSLTYLELSENKLCNVPDSIAVWIEDNLQQSQLHWRSSQNCSNRIVAQPPFFYKHICNIDIKTSDGSTFVSYQLARSCHVSVVLYTMHGKLVRKLRDHIQSSGSYSVLCDMKGLSRTMYLLRIAIDGNLFTKKISAL